MFRRIAFLAAAIAVSAQAAHADPDEQESVVFFCTPGDSHFRVALDDAPEAKATTFATRQVVDYGGLITWSKPNANGDPMRTGSTAINFTCGKFKIAIKGGFYNSNIQGELGAAEDFAALEITAQQKTVKVSLAYTDCELVTREKIVLGDHIGAYVDGGIEKPGGAQSLTVAKVCGEGAGERRTTETIRFN